MKKPVSLENKIKKILEGLAPETVRAVKAIVLEAIKNKEHIIKSKGGKL